MLPLPFYILPMSYDDTVTNSLGFSTGDIGANSLRWAQLSGMLYPAWPWLCLVETRRVCAMDWSLRILSSSDIWCRDCSGGTASGIWPLMLLRAMCRRAWPFELSVRYALTHLLFAANMRISQKTTIILRSYGHLHGTEYIPP